jgi:hypothetical protein
MGVGSAPCTSVITLRRIATENCALLSQWFSTGAGFSSRKQLPPVRPAQKNAATTAAFSKTDRTAVRVFAPGWDVEMQAGGPQAVVKWDNFASKSV